MKRSFAPSFRAMIKGLRHFFENLKIATLKNSHFQIFSVIKPAFFVTALKDGTRFLSFSLFPFSFLLFAFLLMLSSCDYNRRSTGWEYFDDMVTSPAYESYTANPNFTDGKTMQPPVAGTIPRGMIPYPYAKADEDRALAAKTLVNELNPTPENLARGEKEYGIFCAQCHGDKGDGKGRLFVSKKFPYPPANLLSEKMMANPAGDIYHVITVGFGVMAPHGSMIKPDDRWKIAMYIKEELQK